MEPSQDPNRSRNTFRLLAVAAGLWFLGSGVWGLLTETPQDRAVLRCEAAARGRADADTVVEHTSSRQEQGGWFVAGEVRRTAGDVVSVDYRWECVPDDDGRAPRITAWPPAG